MFKVMKFIFDDLILCIPPSYIAAYTPDVRVSQTGLNSLLVSWTYRSSWPAVTGFLISYYQLDGGHNGLVTAGRNDNNATISGLTALATYSISVVANSSTLPSNASTTRFNLGIYTSPYHRQRMREPMND